MDEWKEIPQNPQQTAHEALEAIFELYRIHPEFKDEYVNKMKPTIKILKRLAQ